MGDIYMDTTIVTLPDGTEVNIGTTEGANEFLTKTSNFEHFSSYLKKIEEISAMEPSVEKDRQLKKLFHFIIFLPQYGDVKLFRENIPKSEIQSWLESVVNEIKILTEESSLMNIGIADQFDSSMLATCRTMFCHAVPANLALESNFFQLLAAYIKVLNGNERESPYTALSDYIGDIMLRISITVYYMDTDWTPEQMFQRFEESGMLEHILRCSTYPISPGSWYYEQVFKQFCAERNFWDIFLSKLQSFPRTLKKLKTGKPCGDTLKAILEGRDGNPDISPVILNRLKYIARIVQTVYTTEFKKYVKYGICNYCLKMGTSEAPLEVCAKCCQASYCCTKCEKADWKERHREECTNLEKMTKGERDLVFWRHLVTARFMHRNFEAIFHGIDDMCCSTGLEASDLAVELDFLPNEAGICPALHEPPMFNIVPLRDYISGAMVPAWFKPEDFGGRLFKDFVAEKALVKSPSAVLLIHTCDGWYYDPETVDKCRNSDALIKSNN